MMPHSPNSADPNSYPALSEAAERIFSQGKRQREMSVARRYGMALILVSAAFGLAQTFLYYGLPLPFTAFALSAIAATFWYGGTKPGILAALISWLVRDAFFEPEVSVESRILYGLAYLVFALVMILVMRGRNELEARVAERTAELTKTAEDLRREIARQKGTEDELRTIMDSAPVFLWSDLPDGYCDFLNQRWLTYFNLSLQEAQGAGWATLLHPDDAGRHLENWQKSVSAGIPFETEARFRCPDGEYRWFLTRANPLRDKTGKIVKWYGTNIDIENLKRTETRLRQSEAYLAEAQKLSRTGTWAFNRTKTLYWSEEGYRLWGLDPQDGLPTREMIVQRIHPDDRDRVLEGGLTAIREKKDYAVEFRIILPDGTVKHIETCCRHMYSEDGELAEVLGTHIDVTERRLAEEALRESEYKLRQIIETVPGFLWSNGPDGEVTHVNRRVLDYSGRKLEDYQQRGWEALLHPDDRAETAKAFQHAIQTGTSYQAVFRLRRADGEYRWYHARGEPLRDRQGRIIQWYGLSVDIDEAKKAEDRLRRSETYLAEAQSLTHTGSWAIDPATRKVLYWSEECYRIWGFDPAQGLPYRGIVQQRIHPDDRDKVHAETQEALRQQRDYTIEFRIVLPDGTVKYLEAVGHHRFSASGKLVQMVGTNVDVTERRRAEAALRESEAKIRRLVDADIIGIFMWDAEGGIVEANDAFLRMMGYDREDLVSGRIHWTELTPPEWRDRDVRRWLPELKAKATGSLQPFEKEYFRKDGSRVPVLMGVASFEEDANQGVAFVLDMTEGKRAEAALRESEAKIRRLVDANIIGIFIWDFDGRIIEANDAFLCMVDYDRENLVSGRIRWTDLTPPEWREGDEGLLPELKMTGSLQPFEKEYFRKDGSRVSVLIGAATFEEGGNQGVAFVLDLTERKRAEAALRESEAKFRDYAETASDWFWEIGPDYKFTLLTENAFGSEPADRIGTTCWDHALDLETEPEKWRLIQAALDSRQPFRDFTYCSKGRDGSPIYVKASGSPVFDANGKFRGYRGTGSDVTAIMQAQRVEASLRTELAHVSRVTTLGQLTASIAHEITQPIAAARNNARAAVNFLQRQPPDLGEVSETLECVVADADRAGVIIDRIRDQMKKAPPRSEYFDLNKAIDEVIALARSEIIKNGISVQTRFAEELSPVKGDRVQMQQVVMNLILNAIEALSSVEAGERELLVSTEQDQTGDVVAAVRDSGPGIDPEHADRLFEAFFTTKSTGVGMGLSICRSIIEAHGGRLWADVNEPRGAAFWFTLAIAEQEEEIINPVPATRQTAERNEDTVLSGSRQPACEGSKQPRRSKREPGQRHWYRQ